MHTNSTPNYNLPQFVGTDIINPLTDINDAFSTIDTTMKNIANEASSDTSAITALQVAVGDSESGLVKAVNDLEAQNGDAALTTSAQTLSGAINELDNAVDGNTGNISTLVQKVGSDTLTTTAQTCTGAINELDGDIETGYLYSLTHEFIATADGVKTYGELMNEAFTDLNTFINGLGDTDLFKFAYLSVGNSGGLLYQNNSFRRKVDAQEVYIFFNLYADANSVSFRRAFLRANSTYETVRATTVPAITISQLANEIATVGNDVKLYVEKYIKQK